MMDEEIISQDPIVLESSPASVSVCCELGQVKLSLCTHCALERVGYFNA